MTLKLGWSEVWKRKLIASSWWRRRQLTEGFWDKLARHYNEVAKRRMKGIPLNDIIELLNVDENSTVLDVGGGPGTYAIPLAKVVKEVTVVEPSKGMIECLKENMDSEGVSNIRIVNKRWEDVELSEIGQHDTVLASHSLAMLDLDSALLKMHRAARRRVVIMTFAGPRYGFYPELYEKVFNEKFIPGPDYIDVYNVLYDLGIYANITIKSIQRKETYRTIDDAVKRWASWLMIDESDKMDRIREVLERYIEPCDEGLCFRREFKEAIIWWDVREVKPIG
ncbi:MAG: class I SAM-dependent methyltransferase [Candidatus Nezhaarchaeales archaeon]